jgi:NAD(P)-dependent dehydrogenase (short-subunit alcohol dehydrogenase family)
MSSKKPLLLTKGKVPSLRESNFCRQILEPMLIRNYSLGMDVVDEESIKKGVESVSEVDGKLDILVNK